MAKDPAVLFYCGDFLNGCADLTMEERGQYITLLCLQHQKGHLSEKTICLSVGSVSVDVLAKFEKDEAGLFFHQRMESEMEKRANFINSRKINGLSGGRPKKEKPYAKPYAKANNNLLINENENRDEDINKDRDEKITLEIWPTFNDFWNAYDKKADKPKCEAKWNKLKQHEKEQIMKHVPDYVESTPEKQYRKNPLTYLNSKSYENELIQPTGKQNKGNNEIANGFALDLAEAIRQRDYGNQGG